MLRGTKSDTEVRFELLTWGLILVSAAICWVIFRQILPSMILFVPGLFLLGSAIFQDMQPDWQSSWFTYLLAAIVVATGLAGIINTLMGDVVKVLWLIIAIVELGAVLIAKALFDPTLS